MRRVMLPIDFCHLHDWRSPVPRELLASPWLSPREHLAESWAPCGWPGNRVFHDTRERFGGSQIVQPSLLDTLCRVPLHRSVRGGDAGVGVIFPRRPLWPSLWHFCRLPLSPTCVSV